MATPAASSFSADSIAASLGCPCPLVARPATRLLPRTTFLQSARVVVVPHHSVTGTAIRGGHAAMNSCGVTCAAGPLVASSLSSLLDGVGIRASIVVRALAPAAAGYLPPSLVAGGYGHGSGGDPDRFGTLVVKAIGHPGNNNGDDDTAYEEWNHGVIRQWEVSKWTYRPEVYTGDILPFQSAAQRAIALLHRMLNTKCIESYPSHCKESLFMAGLYFRRLHLQTECGNVQLATVLDAVREFQVMFPQVQLRDPKSTLKDPEPYFKELSEALTEFIHDVELVAELSEYRDM